MDGNKRQPGSQPTSKRVSQEHVPSADEAGPAPDTTETHRLFDELRHKALNVMSVIQATIRMSSVPRGEDMGHCSALISRLNALILVHGMAISNHPKSGLGFRWLLEQLVQPHAPSESTLTMDGSDFEVPEDALTALTLILHELASHTRIYGGWSQPYGQARLTWTSETDQPGGVRFVRIEWCESDTQEHRQSGTGSNGPDPFGSVFVYKSVLQLNGRFRREFAPTCVCNSLEFRL